MSLSKELIMHKIYTSIFTLCLNFLSFSMANDTVPSPEEIRATIAVLQQRGEKTQQDHSQKEERMRIKHQNKKREMEKQKIKQEILGTFPGTPTPDSLEELQHIRVLLKERLRSEILADTPGLSLPDDLYQLKMIHNAFFSDSDKAQP